MEKVDVIIGNVKNEVHTIGKCLFIKEVENSGFKVLDLGVSISTDKFVNAIKKTEAKVLVLTGLLNSAPDYMRKISQRLQDERIRNNVKILIGGPNVNEDWLKMSEADAIAKDISEAVKILYSWNGLLKI